MSGPETTRRELDPEASMIIVRAEGWYPIMGVKGVPLAKQAADNAACNPGTLRVEDMQGNVLWRLQ